MESGDGRAMRHRPPGRVRSFCGTCGSPVAYQTEKLPDEIHFHAALLEDPTGFEPNAHYFFGEHLDWLKLDDDLVKHTRGG